MWAIEDWIHDMRANLPTYETINKLFIHMLGVILMFFELMKINFNEHN